ncbi:MAG: ribonuclease HII [Betaproteobacteria bacterium]|nr:ribonuclease HII [Betaproteobacteria bacterium]
MGARLLCGTDEAGRGCLAGDVFAAAVILDAARPIAGLADSKVLSERKRNALEGDIRARALAWAVARASVEEIDRLNILQASLLAMRRAIAALGVVPHEVLVDGLHVPDCGLPSQAIVDGDQLVAEISAASILAKTARDAYMREEAARHPRYGFDAHKGYGTPAHLDALARFGPCGLHRRSFAPVRVAAQQMRLFAE